MSLAFALPINPPKEGKHKYDPFAMACFTPTVMELIPDILRDAETQSKSQRKRYTSRSSVTNQAIAVF